MGERKKYPYNEKAKERTMRHLKKCYDPLHLNLKKGLKDKYKAFAASRGMSLTELIVYYLETEIENSGFVYEPETEESADE